ncbi:MAG: UDP-glucose/GDP-mannose dehydrogenase family protein [Candidatus Beckwithbacteria bacterium]|nr:UDP-glucose/GDP-mannose dehydrogenase family protein [Candidatus Beckwithbacteria bacterium]
MKVCVLGTGYVGLVTAAVFSHLGHQVVGLDIDEQKVAKLKKGEITIYESGLETLFAQGLDSGRLTFTTDYREAIKDQAVIFICVGTPPKKDGSYDSRFVFSAAESVAQNLTNYAVIVIKSTVPPSTTQIVEKIIKTNTKKSFDVASVPEFLREGSAVNDALSPARIIFGVNSDKAEKILRQVHQKIKAPVLVMTPASAQLVKYASNAMLATRISFINSMAILCDKVGADINDVASGLGLDPRIGQSFLAAGLGYGGSCFPKDTWALISFARSLGYDFNFLKQVDAVNNDQIDYFIGKIKTAYPDGLKGKILTVLGLAFKPNTDDLREARSTVLINRLKKLGVIIHRYDPVIKTEFSDPYQALIGADGLILVTEWQAFKELNFKKLKRLMNQPFVFDGRNFYDPKKITSFGFQYIGIGRR